MPLLGIVMDEDVDEDTAILYIHKYHLYRMSGLGDRLRPSGLLNMTFQVLFSSHNANALRRLFPL